MKRVTSYHDKIRIWFVRAAFISCMIWIFFMPEFTPVKTDEEDIFTVSLNGTEVGVIPSRKVANECLSTARRMIAADSDEIVLAEANMEITGRKVVFGKVDQIDEVAAKMAAVLRKDKRNTLSRAYSIKINEFSINVSSKEDVETILKTTLNRYDTYGQFDVNLVLDPDREVNVLTTSVVSNEDEKRKQEQESPFIEAGIQTLISDVMAEVEPLTTEKAFSDYDLGLQTIDFGDKVEIVESYLLDEEITDLSTATEEITKDQETNQIYEVKSGDTLSTIAEQFNLSVKDLVDMNASLDNENSLIRIGDEITVTVPEPELSVIRCEQQYYEEDYEADIKYVDNDSWYTNETKVLQQPSAGHRKVCALVTFENDKEISSDIQKEEITYQAVPKIVERGTKIPPTYIKPISGGRMSSGFGPRNVRKRGASRYHKGIDWSTPVGTAVMASSTGVVVRAGWGSGYGYCIYIDHADGNETRYGHLSKLLVRVGERVTQGEKIALSGNTGVSTGPHIHFEILVGGTQVNPLKILN